MLENLINVVFEYLISIKSQIFVNIFQNEKKIIIIKRL